MTKSMENTLNGKGLAIQNSKKTQTAPVLNTENKLSFIFNFEDLEIQIPGGLNDERHDRMRVTVKIKKTDSNSIYAVRHSLNLFNGREVEKLIIRTSYELETSDIILRRAFIRLTDELETYRLESQENEHEEPVVVYDLPEEEQAEALALLKSKDLLKRTSNLIKTSGLVGEETNAPILYLAYTSRKMDNPLHCIIHGSSGSGKTHLLSKTSEFIPNEEKIEFTQLSANAFYYYGRYELKHKLILIEDLDGAEDGLLPLRELQTKKRISKSVVHKGIGGIGRTKELIVEGPVSVAGCTTKASIYEDNSNRSFLLHVDESEEQDNRIMAYQRKQSAGRIDIETEQVSAKVLRNVQRLLQPVKVINPFAQHLELPKTVFKPRRTNMHYLQLIEVITFYHQYQRQWIDVETGEVIYSANSEEVPIINEYQQVYIETQLEDIELANTLIKDVLLRKSDRLNGATRNYFEKLNSYLNSNNTDTYSNKEIRKAFRIHEATLRRYHKSLEQEGYIEIVKKDRVLSDTYKVIERDEFQDLEHAIQQSLKLCLDSITTSYVNGSSNA